MTAAGVTAGEDRPVAPKPIKGREPDWDVPADSEAGEDEPNLTKSFEGGELNGDVPATGGDTSQGTLSSLAGPESVASDRGLAALIPSSCMGKTAPISSGIKDSVGPSL